MKDSIKSFFKPTHSSVSIKFILGLTLLIILSGLLITFIYGWSASTIIDQNTISEEKILSGSISSNITNYLIETESALTSTYSQPTPNPTLSKYFDIGVIQSVNGQLSELDFNASKFPALETFSRSITIQTPLYSYNPGTESIYIVFRTPTGFSVGGVDATGIEFKNLLTSSRYSIALVDNSGNIITSNNSRITNSMLGGFNINYDYFQQIKFGNTQKQILTYSPIPQTTLGIALLSSPILTLLIPNINGFVFFLILLLLILFLAIIVIFSLLVGIPLTRIVTFFDDYNNGKVREIRLNSDDTFGNISNNINTLIKKVSIDFKRIEQEDQIQNDFLLLSGHLLRTPLTSIQGYLDILKAQNQALVSNPIIDKIDTALLKLITLIENILTISKGNDDIINSPTEKILVSEIMGEAFEAIHPRSVEKNINMLLDTANMTNIMILANKKNIVLALRNLLSNAVKFTSEGGTVKLYAINRGNEIVLSVSDTGIGLTKEEGEQIFKKFSKISDTMEYNAEGFGIGLYVVKLIAERYKGRVWVDSIKGSGSIFNILLPIENAVS